MSWASRRRTLYVAGVFTFFLVLIGVPVAYKILTIPETCHDGLMNQDETAPDRGGPCLLLDERRIAPSAVVWTRSFKVRQPIAGTTTKMGARYNVLAYVENPNEIAGVMTAPYRFSLYDSENVLVAEREGVGFIAPGGITPIFEGNIDTGNRTALRALFTFTAPLSWARTFRTTDGITASNIRTFDLETAPRIQASVTNRSPSAVLDVSFVIAVFDRGDNAFAASATKIDRIESGATEEIVFTWPDPFPSTIGKIEILPVRTPIFDKNALR